jgi:hypothetical protein
VAASGAAVAYCAAGGLVLYSGIKGATIASTVQSVLTGNLNVSDTETVNFGSGSSAAGSGSGTASGSASASAPANQALAKTIIQANSAYAGWDTGQEWSDLVSLWDKESGWSAIADNSSSGAYGIAQALGHGTSGAPYPGSYNAANPPQYGGTSNPGEQIEWGLSYIAGTYGTPILAWAHETANDWY